jgi:predicted nuclease of predicted toxin-antitoxin system
MNLLLDENISYRAVKKLSVAYPHISHVKMYNLSKNDDKEIWEFAKKENYTIVTNDADFNDFSVVWGFPPKIIWLRTGNTSTDSIVNLLIDRKNEIESFLANKKMGILIYT